MANLILWNTLNTDNSTVRPIACYQLASWIRQHGYTVKVIDYCHAMTTDELVAITNKHIGSDTLAIGVGTTFWNKPGTMLINSVEPQWVIDARLLLASSVKYWLLGGPASAVDNMKFNWIKFRSFSEDSLLQWIDQNSSKLVRRELFDIKTASLHFSDTDNIQPYEVLPTELGRGCQFKCRFCSFPLAGKRKGTYIKDFELTREALIRNYSEFGVTRYCILDDTVNESEEKIFALADIAQHLPFKLEWIGYNRLDLIWSRPATIQALKDSGLKSAFFGIESFHPEASMAVGKGWMGKQGKEFLLKLKEEWGPDVNWYLSFIVGLPGETVDSLEDTVNWCITNKMYNWEFNCLIINRGSIKTQKSEFELEYEKYGYSYADDSTHNWKNNNWTMPTAAKFSDYLNRKSYLHRTLSGFAYSRYGSLGYAFEDLVGKHIASIPQIEITAKTKNRIDEYVRYQLSQG
jgi:hypothetical protein